MKNLPVGTPDSKAYSTVFLKPAQVTGMGCKRYILNGAGIWFKPEDQARFDTYFYPVERPWQGDPVALMLELALYASRGYFCIPGCFRGRMPDQEGPPFAVVDRKLESNGGRILDDAPTGLLILDIDGMPLPDPEQGIALIPPAIAQYALEQVLPEAAACPVIFHYSQSMGLGLKQGINIHLFIVLSSPVLFSRITPTLAYLNSRAGLPPNTIDPALGRPTQPVFIREGLYLDHQAKPLPDPFTARSLDRWGILNRGAEPVDPELFFRDAPAFYEPVSTPGIILPSGGTPAAILDTLSEQGWNVALSKALWAAACKDSSPEARDAFKVLVQQKAKDAPGLNPRRLKYISDASLNKEWAKVIPKIKKRYKARPFYVQAERPRFMIQPDTPLQAIRNIIEQDLTGFTNVTGQGKRMIRHLIKASPGTGKTYSAIKAFGEQAKDSRVIHAVDTIQLGQQVLDTFHELHGPENDHALLWVGLTGNLPDGTPACARQKDIVLPIAQLGARPLHELFCSKHLDGGKIETCPYYESCPVQKQRQALLRMHHPPEPGGNKTQPYAYVICTYDVLMLERSDELKTDTYLIDEEMGRFCNQEILTAKALLKFPRGKEILDAFQDAANQTFEAVKAKQPVQANLIKDLLLERGIDEEFCRVQVATWGSMISQQVAALSPGKPDSELADIALQLAKAIPEHGLPFFETLLQELHFPDQPCSLLSFNHHNAELTLFKARKLAIKPSANAIFLNATGRPEMLEQLTGKPVSCTVRRAELKATVIKVAPSGAWKGFHFTNSWLEKPVGTGMVQKLMHSLAYAYGEQNLALIMPLGILKGYLKQKPKLKGLKGKIVKGKVKDASWYGVKIATYCSLRGRNDLGSCKALILLGRHQPPDYAIKGQTAAFYWRDSKARAEHPLPMLHAPFQIEVQGLRGLDHPEKGVWGIPVQVHPQPEAQMILEMHREDETYQALYRIIRDKEPDKIIYDLSGVVLDVTYSGMGILSDLIPSEPLSRLAGVFMKQGLITGTGQGTLLKKLAPRVWGTPNAAYMDWKKALDEPPEIALQMLAPLRRKLGPTPYNIYIKELDLTSSFCKTPEGKGLKHEMGRKPEKNPFWGHEEPPADVLGLAKRIAWAAQYQGAFILIGLKKEGQGGRLTWGLIKADQGGDLEPEQVLARWVPWLKKAGLMITDSPAPLLLGGFASEQQPDRAGQEAQERG